MEALLQDLRFALRRLSRKPAFVAVAVLSLALGICANVVIFSLVDTLLFKPLPVREPDRLVALFAHDHHTAEPHGLAYPDVRDLGAHGELFSGVVAQVPMPFGYAAGETPERVWGVVASDNYFTELGVSAALGRAFAPGERGPFVVVSHAFWVDRMGRRPDAVGSSITLNGKPFTVIGVAPAEFTGTEVILTPDLWLPIGAYEGAIPGSEWIGERDAHTFRVLGRLAPGVGLEALQAALPGLAAELSRADPKAGKDLSLSAYREADARPEPQSAGGATLGASMLLFVVGLVLLIACSNVANLLLAQAAVRRREIAVRVALGATGGRVVRLLLTESVVLGLLGGGAGLLLTLWVADLLPWLKPPTSIPLMIEAPINGRVLAFTLAVSVVSGVVFGLAPALRAARQDLAEVMKGEGAVVSGGRKLGLRGAIVVGQIALSVVLLVTAALLGRSLLAVRDVDPGIEPEKLLLASLDPKSQGYDAERTRVLYGQLAQRVGALPGVRGVSFAHPVPLDFTAGLADVVVDGKSNGLLVSEVDAAYFTTAGTPIVAGRSFGPDEIGKAPRAVILNQTAAAQLFPGQDAIGKTVRVEAWSKDPLEVVGIAKDGKYRLLGEAPRPYLFAPLFASGALDATMLVRTEGDPGALAGPARAELRALDQGLPMFEVKTMQMHLARALFPIRVAAVIVATLGGLALLLAALGLYGVMSYSVAQRTREIGVRMALGAPPEAILRLVLAQAARTAAIGLVIGLAAAGLLAQLIGDLLYGVSPLDPATYAGVSALLLAVALLASFVPARRATKLAPMVALRYD